MLFKFCSYSKSLKTFYILLLLLVNLNGIVYGLELDSDGGYHIKLSIKSDRLDPNSANEYVQQVKEEIGALATLIYHTSEENFFLKSSSILIPSNWVVTSDEIATSQSFDQSDIKISDNYLIPDVIRPTQCEKPGEEIRLPSSFFEAETNELYKAKEKALLHLWAQYRWGVFDESGYAGSNRFPYSVKNVDKLEWQVNACVDVDEFSGAYKYPNQTDCIVNDEDVPPNSECRFVPDNTQNDVHSSLMNNFYWIDSMDSFCTSTSHNILLPNRQNVFCSYKSVMEVMQKCPDYMKVTEKGSYVDPTFQILKQSEKPLVYLLIDSRNIPIPESEVNKIRTELKKMFDDTVGLDGEGLAAFAKFPGDDDKLFQELEPWTVLKDKIANFELLMDDTISQGKTTDGLFGIAIKSISESIKVRGHTSGALVFVLRSTPSTNFDLMPFEEDVIASLTSQKIKLFALEISGSALDLGRNLFNLAIESGGVHINVSQPQEISEKLPAFISSFIEESKNPSFKTPSTTIFKDIIFSTSATEIKILMENVILIRVSFTSNVPIDNVSVNSKAGPVSINEVEEWNESTGKGRRTTFKGIHGNIIAGEVLTVTFACSVEVLPEKCQGLLVIRAESDQSLKETEELKISVSTSLVDNKFDENARDLIIVFAKLEIDGQPLVDLHSKGILTASAKICRLEDSSDCSIVLLNDNGAGFPDLISNDGILSGTFSKISDGTFNCHVLISYETAGENFVSTNELLRRQPKSIDQNLFPCYITEGTEDCVGIIAYKNFQIVGELHGEITITNSTNLPQIVISRIMDVKIDSKQVSWTSPSVFSNNGIESVESYDVRFCYEMDKLLTEFDSCTQISIPVDKPALPGSLETVALEFEDEVNRYIAIRSKFQDSNSEISNIIYYEPSNENVTSSPTESTTENTSEPTDNTSEQTSSTSEPTDNTSEQTSSTSEPTDNTSEQTSSTSEPTDNTSEQTSSTSESTDNTSEQTPSTSESTDNTSEQTSSTSESTDNTSEQTPSTSESTDNTSEQTSSTSESTDNTSEQTPSTSESTDNTSEQTSSTSEPTDNTSEQTPSTSESTDNTSESTSITSESTSNPPSPSTEATTTEIITTNSTETGDTSTDLTSDPTEFTDIPTTEKTTTRRPITSTIVPQTTEESEYFFKKPIGYITASAIALVAAGGISAAVGYLCWKRNLVMKASKSERLITKQA